MLIKPNQIRAARGLLDWTMEELSTRAGVSKPMISQIEGGSKTGSVDTLTKIEKAFIDGGVEFLPNDGVGKKPDLMKIYKGHTGFVEFSKDVYNTVKKYGGEICVSNVNERNFDYWLGEALDDYDQKMTELTKEIDYKFRILIESGDEYFAASKYAEYRWLKKEHFSEVPFYVYGNKIAIILFKQDALVYVIENQDISDAYRTQFFVMWDMGRVPTYKGKAQ